MDNSDPGPLFSPPPPGPIGRERTVISVTELNRRTRNLLEANLELLWVGGELSNVVRAASGHWYFSLKDEAAQVRCVMFKHRAAALGFAPENGLKVEVRALPSLYEPRGEFQLGVETMRRAGLGSLFEAYERLKAKLAAEGLFDETRKRTPPFFPRAIGVITSPQAAALRDVLTTLKRRAPMIDVILYPASVQGAAAAGDLVNALDAARTRREVDTLIVCRGGGGIEDLWPFNEEAMARAIARFQAETGIPVISGVGHETDFTICDFVADRRAPTPTAAAELASPSRDELLAQVSARREQFVRGARRWLETAQQKLDRAARGLLSPAERLMRERDRLSLLSARARHALSGEFDAAAHRLALNRQRILAQRPDLAAWRTALAGSAARIDQAQTRGMNARRQQLDHARKALELLSPRQVLTRGYGIVQHQGAILRRAKDAPPGATIAVQLAEGALEAEVTRVKDDG